MVVVQVQATSLFAASLVVPQAPVASLHLFLLEASSLHLFLLEASSLHLFLVEASALEETTSPGWARFFSNLTYIVLFGRSLSYKIMFMFTWLLVASGLCFKRLLPNLIVYCCAFSDCCFLFLVPCL